jgi:hypothetical protein
MVRSLIKMRLKAAHDETAGHCTPVVCGLKLR